MDDKSSAYNGTANKLSTRLINNTLYNILGAIWAVLLSLCTTPYIVYKLGNDSFGIFSVVMVIAGYFSILDFGFGSAVIKYLSEKKDEEADNKTSGKIIGTAFSSNLFAGFIGSAAMFVFADKLALYFVHSESGSTGPILQEASNAIRICTVIFFLNMASAVFLSILQAKQRFDLLNILMTVNKTALTLGMVIVLASGGNLYHVMYSYLAITLFSLLYYFFSCRKILPIGISFRPQFDRHSFRRLFSFGLFTTIGKVASLLVRQLDRLILGAMMPIKWVSFYSVPSSISLWIVQATTKISPVIFPAASEIRASDSPDKLQTLFTKSMKYCFILSLPLCVLMAAIPDKVLLYWLGPVIGPEFASKSSLSLTFLAVGALFESLTAVPAMIILGIGRPDIQAIFAITSGVANAALLMFLVPRFGINGASLSYMITTTLFGFICILYVIKKLRFNMMVMLWKSIIPASFAGMVYTLILLLCKPLVTSRILLILFAVLGGLVFLLFLIMFKAIGKEEYGIALSYLNRLKSNKKH